MGSNFHSSKRTELFSSKVLPVGKSKGQLPPILDILLTLFRKNLEVALITVAGNWLLALIARGTTKILKIVLTAQLTYKMLFREGERIRGNKENWDRRWAKKVNTFFIIVNKIVALLRF